MKQYKLKTVVTIVLVITLTISCKESFLDVTVPGVVNPDALNSVANTEGLIIAAYAGYGNSNYVTPHATDYVWGSVRSDDGHKGGSATSEEPSLNAIEQKYLVTPSTGGYINATWVQLYANIARINLALRQLDLFTDDQYVVGGEKVRTQRRAEMLFARAHFMFLLKRLWKYPVWVDYDVVGDDLRNVGNRVFTSDQLWDKIAADFQFAVDNLPVTQAQPGRPNQWAAKAYLAKVRLYQAYVQDDAHAVVSVDNSKLDEVISLTTDIITNGPYSLEPNFATKWLFGNDFNKEAIFSIQYSYDDGTTTGRVDFEHGLNYPQIPEYGCCGYHNISANMVAAFQTDAVTGLPLFDTYNTNREINSLTPAHFEAPFTFDPRLDHTVGIPGHPFKYDVNFPVTNLWSRAPTLYGYYISMKELQLPSCNCLRKANVFIGTAKNWDVLQYNDVILMKAEALIQRNNGGLPEAMSLINQIRARANSTATKGSVTYPAGHAKAGQGFSNYHISLYDGVNLPWTQANALKALEFERRLEFATESPRFHDLVRWGIAADRLNDYYQKEKTRFSYLGQAVFTPGRDEYLPIDQTQINLVNGLYVQNPGY